MGEQEKLERGKERILFSREREFDREEEGEEGAIMTSWQPTASNVQTKSLGMTAPINTEEPKPADIELTLALEVIDKE